MTRVHGQACRLCVHFPTCTKTPRPEQIFCEFPENRFERKP